MFSKAWFEKGLLLAGQMIELPSGVVLRHLGVMPEFCGFWRGYACFSSMELAELLLCVFR